MATQFKIEFLSPSKAASYDATSMIIPGKVGYMTIFLITQLWFQS